MKDYVRKIENALRLTGIKFLREYAFLMPHRRFKFDFLVQGINGENLLEQGIKIAIEFEGGIFVKGRHTRGRDYSKDCEKYNLAQLNGYVVLRYTPLHFNKRNAEFIIADEILTAIKILKGEKEGLYWTNHFGKRKIKNA